MPDMENFLEVKGTFGSGLAAVVAAVAMLIAVTFIVIMIMADFPFVMMLIALLPFAAFAFFFMSVLRKSKTGFSTWWNSISGYERADIEADYSRAVKVDPILILGERYAYIRYAHIPIRYEDITDVYFMRTTKNQQRMVVNTRDGRKHLTYLALLSDRSILEEELMKRCGIEVFENGGNYPGGY